MKFGGYKLVPLAKIIGPGDVKKRQKTEEVKALAASIEKLGDEPMHAIVAIKEAGAWEIVAGRDRFSALMLLKARTTWVHVVTKATPLEVLELEIEENLKRRQDDRDALVADMVRRAVPLMPAGKEFPVAPTGNSARQAKDSAPVGRAKSAEGAAREVVAKAMGTTPEAVRSAVKRDESRREETATVAGAPDNPAPKPSLPIETFGRPVPAMVQVRVMAALDVLGAFDKAARSAQRACAEMEAALMVGERPPWLQGMRDLAHGLGATARALFPAYLCPLCVDSEEADEHGIAPRCKLCGFERTITQDQYDALPPEQKNGGTERAAGLDPAPAEPPEAREHRRTFALHSKGPGGTNRCGCFSCNYVRRLDGVPEVHPGLDHARDAKAKKAAKKQLRVGLPDGTEVVAVDAARDDEAWT